GSGSSVSISFLLSMMKSVPLIEPEDFDICPVLLAHPEIDKWTPTEISKLFFDRISCTRDFTLLENAGHFPIESPGLQQLNQASVSFITKYNG
ncbi:MAG: alpha/beta hydrolase, partial [Spirochaetales bacterium]|nr:alpha/beta hydrolase [Spirochaetales bacterium]